MNSEKAAACPLCRGSCSVYCSVTAPNYVGAHIETCPRCALVEAEEWRRRCVAIVQAVGRAEGVAFEDDWKMSDAAKREVLEAVEAADVG